MMLYFVCCFLDNAKESRSNMIPASEYYCELDETLHHLHFCAEQCANFRGQTEILSKTKAYLKNPKNMKPLVKQEGTGAG